MKINKIEIEKKLPIRNVEDGVIVSKSCDLTFCFKLHLPEVFNLSFENLESLHHVLNKSFTVLPENTVVCKQDWFVKAEYITASEEDESGELIHPDKKRNTLSRSSERHFIGRPFRDHLCYLFITKVASKKQREILQNPLVKNRLIDKGTVNQRTFDDFKDSISQFAQIINDSGYIKAELLNDDDIIGTPEKRGLIEKYLTLDTNDKGPLVDYDFRDGMRVGDKYCKMFTMADANDMPSPVGPRIRYENFSTDKTSYSIGFASHLGLLLDCNHIYSQYIYLCDVENKKKELESKKNRMFSLSTVSRSNAHGAENIDQFLNTMHTTGQKPVRMHFNIMCWNENRVDLGIDSNKVASAITKIGGTPKLETATIAPLFWYGIPGAAGDLSVEETFDGFMEEATCMFNLETNYRSSLSPIGVKYTDRLTQLPVHVDLSDEPKDLGYISNRNKFVVGGTGSGKSFNTNHMVRHYLEQNTDVVIVDIGHSYEGLCKMMGGYYFTYTEDNYIKFNPFITYDGKKPDTEKAESLKSLIISLYGKDWNPEGSRGGMNELTRGEYMAISNSIAFYYQHLEENPDIKPSFNTYYEYLEKEFRQKLKDENVREKDFDLANLLFVLKSFYKGGEYDYLLNSEENLDLHDQKFIVFEIDAIKDNPVLFPVVTIIIMEVFISKMRKKKGVRKVMLIEEAWKAIARSGMAEFIKYLYKTCRKYFGETWIVTQEIEDMLDSPIIKNSIINNADTKIILDLSKFQNKFDKIQSLMGFTDHEADKILSLNQGKSNVSGRKFKDVFVSFNSNYSNVYSLEVSREEYFTYTTEEKEKKAVQELAEKKGNYVQAVQEVARSYNS